ncbi:hypothetical protein [Salipiger bermudensis]|uniref:hypothetical protein n=1 Tax=Salipiger bermudensis TaxID=344736 RepID=UPI001A90A6EA|nr:hypothetical protein [Salipiger bermudensis]
MSGTTSNDHRLARAKLGAAARRLRWPLRSLLAVTRRKPPLAERVAEESVLTPGVARAFLNRAERSFRPPPS